LAGWKVRRWKVWRQMVSRLEGAKAEGQKVKYGDTMHPIGSEQ
jgi:hypothetical protein